MNWCVCVSLKVSKKALFHVDNLLNRVILWLGLPNLSLVPLYLKLVEERHR